MSAARSDDSPATEDAELAILERTDDPVIRYLLDYVPRRAYVPGAAWEATRMFTLAASAQAAPLTKYEAKYIVTPLAQFVTWAWSIGVPINRKDLLKRHLVERFILERTTRLSTGSRGNYRSVLYRVCDALNRPIDAPHRPLALTASSPARPYSNAEETAHRAMVRGQSTAHKRAQLLVLLALCYGAGVPTEEIALLRGGHVDADGHGVALRIPGRRARTVVVRHDWEGVLAEAARSAGDSLLFVPRRLGGARNTLTNFVSELDHGRAPRLSTQRMRATWLVRLMDERVPMKVFQAASGIGTLYGLDRYVTFFAETEPAAARAFLRGGSS